MPHQTSLQLILKSSFWSYLGIFIVLFIGLITNIFIARLLDKELWGVFSTIIVVVSFLSSISELGLNYYIVYITSKFADKGKEQVKKHLVGPIRYKLIILFLIAALMFIFSNQLADIFHIENGGKYFEAGALYFILLNIFGVFSGILRGLKKFKEDSFTSSVHYSVRLILASVFIIFYAKLDGAIAGYIFGVAISTLIQFYLLRSYISLSGKQTESFEKMFSYGFYVGIVSMAATFTVWTDSIMLGVFMGSTVVGVYRIAVSLATASASLLNGISSVMFPYFISEESKGRDSINYLNTALKYSLFLIIPACFGLALSAEGVVNVFFGQQYIEAVLPLFILSYLIIDGVVVSLISSYLASKRYTKILGQSSVLAAILNIILNLFFIPILGLIGAALSSIISRLINLFILLYWSNKNLGKIYEFKYKLPLIGSLLMALFLVLLKNVINPAESIIHLFIFISSGIVVYLVLEQLLGFDVIAFGKKVTKALMPEKFSKYIPAEWILD